MNHDLLTNQKYPTPRELDGVYCRVIRDGKFVNRCFTDLTAEEQERFLESLDKDGLKRLCNHLAETTRRIADELDIVFREPEE